MKSGGNKTVNGPYGKHAGQAMKHTGVADGGKDTGPKATNPTGAKRSNKMLSPGPGCKDHY